MGQIAAGALLGLAVAVRTGEGGEVHQLAPWPERGGEGGGLCLGPGEESSGGGAGGGEVVGRGDCAVARHLRNPNPNSGERDRSGKKWI